MRGTAVKTPEEWIAMWPGWTGNCAMALRDALLAGAAFDLSVKWGNLLFASNGPCAAIHVEDTRVVLALFRGKRLRGLDPAIKASGKYELGNLFYGLGTPVDHAGIAALAAAAAALNAEFGDPTKRSAI
jgi:hypothetical protein